MSYSCHKLLAPGGDERGQYQTTKKVGVFKEIRMTDFDLKVAGANNGVS